MSDFVTDPTKKPTMARERRRQRAAPTPARIPGTTRLLVFIKADKMTERARRRVSGF